MQRCHGDEENRDAIHVAIGQMVDDGPVTSGLLLSLYSMVSLSVSDCLESKLF